MDSPILIQAADDTMVAAWDVVLDIASVRDFDGKWTLIGGQMVYLHALESSRTLHRPTKDADLLVDVRLLPDSTARLSRTLVERGFQLKGPSPSGEAHRFERGRAQVDVLAPDNIGDRANLKTVAPGRTVQTPGGTQALRRTERVLVQHGQQQGLVPRPDLLGAVILKAAAVGRLGKADGYERHENDLILLLSLVEDPFALSLDLTSGGTKYLQRAADRLNEGAWQRLEVGEIARESLEILLAAA